MLLVKFFEYLSVCQCEIEQEIEYLLQKCLKIVFQSPIKGFANNRRVRVDIYRSVTRALEIILRNASSNVA